MFIPGSACDRTYIVSRTYNTPGDWLLPVRGCGTICHTTENISVRD